MTQDGRLKDFTWLDHEAYSIFKSPTTAAKSSPRAKSKRPTKKEPAKLDPVAASEPIFGILQQDKKGGFALVNVDSKLATLPSGKSDKRSKSVKKTVEIAAKTKLEIPLLVTTKSQLLWTFKTKSNNIGFSLVFQDKEIVSYQLYDSHQQNVTVISF